MQQLIFNDDTIKQELKRDVILTIKSDESPENPREWDNISKMVCFHNRYSLGDKNDLSSDYFNNWQELASYLIKELDAKIILPLYLYDHSGITMSTGKFSCSWDSGQVGFIYYDKKTILNEYGIKRVTKKQKERLEKYLIGQVQTYDDYLTGNVYGFVLTDKITGEELDSCWGFYGNDYLNDIMDNIGKDSYKNIEVIDV